MVRGEIRNTRTSLQEANRRLREFQVALRANVAERTAELVQANLLLNQSQEHLRQAQKMESLGRLAGGIAHDFNNLLTVIVLLGEELQAVDGVRPELSAILSAAERGSLLVRQLLAFSRHQVPALKPLEWSDVLGTVSELLGRTLGEEIHLQIRQAPGLRRFMGDVGQMNQVLINLALNARDAMPAGGELTIAVANADLDETYARAHPGVLPGPYVLLEVSDTGTGMDRTIQARVFEPFFTTKAPGKGTGLGLATVFAIVKQCGGHLSLQSEPELGTTFRLYFRAATADSACPAALEEPRPEPQPGHETILLVEDDEPVRSATREILVGAGYRVLEARDGSETVAILSQQSASIDLLVTDVIMAEMNGRLVSDLVRSFRPGLPVLFVSGHPVEAILSRGALAQGIPFLQKPFSPALLRRKIREVLAFQGH